MSPIRESDNRSSERETVSRADIETICVLEAIAKHGCELSALPEKLGLAPTLLSPVTAALAPLQASGWVEICEGGVQITPAGRAWLGGQKSRLQA